VAFQFVPTSGHNNPVSECCAFLRFASTLRDEVALLVDPEYPTTARATNGVSYLPTRMHGDWFCLEAESHAEAERPLGARGSLV